MKLKIISRGFTLIELLIVIAVLGILATVVLVIVDPVEMINRANDSRKRQELQTLYNAIQKTQVFRDANGEEGYPPPSGDRGQQAFIDSGELKNTLGSASYYYATWIAPAPQEFQIDVTLSSKAEREKAAVQSPSCLGVHNPPVVLYMRSDLGDQMFYWCPDP